MGHALDTLTPDVLCLCWDASALSTALFNQPPRCSPAFFNLGCMIPNLSNLQAEEEAKEAKSRMIQALATAMQLMSF